MPRLFALLTFLVPTLGVLFVLRSLLPALDVLSFPLTWPLAVHPDYANAPPDAGAQQPLVAALLSKAQKAHASVANTLRLRPVAPAPGAFVRRIVAVGDLHGDMPNAQAVLQMAGVVDVAGNWTGDVDYFVQTGDIIDRGDDTIKLYKFMDRLREEAHAAGGTVLTHLGNHEWMNAIGDWRYVYPSEIATFGSVAARQKMLARGRIGKSWAANYTTTSRLPLHPALGPPNTDYDPSAPSSVPSALAHAAISFVHGGLAPDYPELTPFPSRINGLGRSLLAKLQTRNPQPSPHPPHPYPGLPPSATDEEKRLYGGDGPLWYRGWAQDPEQVVCARVDDVLKRTGTRRMIMGHTPDFQKIVSRCDGKIIIIDTGISHAYGGALSALSIIYTLTPTTDTSDNKKIWKEKEIVTAIYVDRQEELAVTEREVLYDSES